MNLSAELIIKSRRQNAALEHIYLDRTDNCEFVSTPYYKEPVLVPGIV